RPRRRLRLRPLRPLRARGARAAGSGNVGRRSELARIEGPDVTAPSVLIYGSPEHSADLLHAVPTGIIDPFLYLEGGGRRAATVSVLDADAVRALGVEVIDPYELGRDELLATGRPAHEIEAETSLRAARALGIEAAIVPFEFPAGLA